MHLQHSTVACHASIQWHQRMAQFALLDSVSSYSCRQTHSRSFAALVLQGMPLLCRQLGLPITWKHPTQHVLIMYCAEGLHHG